MFSSIIKWPYELEIYKLKYALEEYSITNLFGKKLAFGNKYTKLNYAKREYSVTGLFEKIG